ASSNSVYDRTRANHQVTRHIPPELGRANRSIRRRLPAPAAPATRSSLIGTSAIRAELKALGSRPLPGARTVGAARVADDRVVPPVRRRAGAHPGRKGSRRSTWLDPSREDRSKPLRDRLLEMTELPVIENGHLTVRNVQVAVVVDQNMR